MTNRLKEIVAKVKAFPAYDDEVDFFGPDKLSISVPELQLLTTTIEKQAEMIEVAEDVLGHYGDSNNWACEQSDSAHLGLCTQKLYRGSLLNGYGIADEALSALNKIKSEMEEKDGK